MTLLNPFDLSPTKNRLFFVTFLQLACYADFVGTIVNVFMDAKWSGKTAFTWYELAVIIFFMLFGIGSALLAILGIFRHAAVLVVPNICFSTVMIIPSFAFEFYKWANPGSGVSVILVGTLYTIATTLATVFGIPVYEECSVKKLRLMERSYAVKNVNHVI